MAIGLPFASTIAPPSAVCHGVGADCSTATIVIMRPGQPDETREARAFAPAAAGRRLGGLVAGIVWAIELAERRPARGPATARFAIDSLLEEEGFANPRSPHHHVAP